MATVPTADLTRWLGEGMYGPGPLHTAAMDELHTRAGRENVARSMAADDLRDMLPDFAEVASVCGIRPEQAEINRQIVVDELRRRDARHGSTVQKGRTVRNRKSDMIAQFRMSPAAELVAITDELRAEAAVESPAFRHRQDLALQLLQGEQDHRSITDPDAAHAHVLADRDGMSCEHGYNPAVCDGHGNVTRRDGYTFTGGRWIEDDQPGDDW
ncbi:hypothetical protein GCM10027258_62620 [Amycolatopsis stemonae]